MKVIQFLDITYPLYVLRKLVEEKLNRTLKNHKFYLQNCEELRDDWNLLRYDIDGEGIVQYHLEIFDSTENSSDSKIDITDVLKPTNDVADLMDLDGMDKHAYLLDKWTISKDFLEIQTQHSMPFDVDLWSCEHVQIWLKWIKQEYNLDLNEFFSGQNGQSLLEFDSINLKVLNTNDFQTHFYLLRKYSIIATNKKVKKNSDSATDSIEFNVTSNVTVEKSCDGQHIQLWQFLIELLINKKDFRDIIEWRGTSGEFRFLQPDRVAYLWGLKKNKQNMTFSTLTRALRYYYQSGLIKKLNKQKYSYQFLFDVEFLLGYSVAELDNLC